MVVEPRRQTAPIRTPARLVIVEARYYEELADELLAGARAAIAAAEADAVVISVAGALEIPVAAAIALDAAAAAGKPFDGVVALGCVVRGETSHYDIVSGESARALMDLGVARRLPVGNAILTVDTVEQAWLRARRGQGDKGGFAADAVLAVIRMTHGLPALLAGGR
jgi:6,7-dimethyl-8-ribityllumazine synthase